MNFKEKVRLCQWVHFKSNCKNFTIWIKNLLKKFGKDTVGVYIFGKKDVGRLSGGKKKMVHWIFSRFKKNKVTKDHEEHGYFLVVPHVSMKIGGNEISGTTMRNILGSPKLNEDKLKYSKLFGYYDKGVYNMNNKFKKLFEFYNQQSVKNLIRWRIFQ